MTQKLDLKEIEKKSFKVTFQDGLWDIFLGGMLFFLGINAIFSHFLGEFLGNVIYFICIVAITTFFIIAKKYLTVPRIGNVKFGSERKLKMKKIALILGMSVGLGFVLYFLSVLKIFPANFGVIIVGTIFIVNIISVFSLLAYYLDFKRVYIYAILFSIPFFFDFFLNIQGAMPLLSIIAGGTVISIGIVLLTRFLLNYPKPSSDELDGSS